MTGDHKGLSIDRIMQLSQLVLLLILAFMLSRSVDREQVDTAEIWKAIAARPTEVPPAWFQKKVEDIEKRVRALEAE